MKGLFLLVFGMMLFCRAEAQEQYFANQMYVQWKGAQYASTSRIPDAAFERELIQMLGVEVDSVRCTFFFSQSENLRRIWRVYLRHDSDRTLALQQLQRQSDLVEYAEPVPELRRFDTPNDLGPNTTVAGGQWYLYRIRAQQAWDIQTGSAVVRVAVVDDAVQTLHPELTGICLPGYDAAQNDFDVEPPTAGHDHGTHIAGLIGANTNNGLGMASLGRGIRILPVKITFDSNPDAVAAGYEGLAWAAGQNVNVINLSWGSPDYSQTGLQVTQNAINANIVLVAAAGNANNSVANYPAAYPGVMSVAATTSTDVRSGFSTYGTWVDVSAPGSSIWSLAPGDGYQVKNGSSFAAPLVAGLAALLKSANQSLTIAEIESCITTSSDQIDALNPDFVGLLGAGRINAQQALLCLTNQNLAFNVALEECTQPGVSVCNNWVFPELRVRNSGLQALNFFRIRYILDSQPPKFYDFSGSLEPGASVLLELDSLFAAPGEHLLRFSLVDALNDGQADGYTADNVLTHAFRVQHPLGLSLPFSENFESTLFTTRDWTVQNGGGSFTWEIAPGESPGIGDWSARVPYYLNDAVGSRDFLMTPSLNFSGYSSINLSYQFAYQPRFNGLSDTLIVSISTDCGENWERLETRFDNSSPSLSTTAPFAQFFLADAAGQWCGAGGSVPACANINLNAFVGLTGVLIRFEGVSSNGNNIYIDNINISGTPSNEAPQASFQLGNSQPVCVGAQVSFIQTSLNEPISYSWVFTGGSPSTSNAAAPVITYSQAGIYPIQLIVTNANGSDTLELPNAVSVEAIPEVVITASQDTTCLGTSVSLQANGASSYIWNPNSTLSSTLGATVSATPQNTTTYTVNGYSSAGCTASASQVIAVVSNPLAPSIMQSGFDLTASSGASYQWFIDGVLQDTLSTQTITPSQNGNYNVRVFDVYGCSSVSTVFPVNWVFIESLKFQDILLIYPQPTNDLIHFKSNAVYDFSLLDIRGRLILQGKTDAPVSLQHLPSGVYFLRLLSEEADKNHHFNVLKQ